MNIFGAAIKEIKHQQESQSQRGWEGRGKRRKGRYTKRGEGRRKIGGEKADMQDKELPLSSFFRSQLVDGEGLGLLGVEGI